jgi:hypothetical protein
MDIVLRDLDTWLEEGCQLSVMKLGDVYWATLDERIDTRWVSLYRATGITMYEAIANLKERVELIKH